MLILALQLEQAWGEVGVERLDDRERSHIHVPCKSPLPIDKERLAEHYCCWWHHINKNLSSCYVLKGLWTQRYVNTVSCWRVICFCSNRPAIWWFDLGLVAVAFLISLGGRSGCDQLLSHCSCSCDPPIFWSHFWRTFIPFFLLHMPPWAWISSVFWM